MATKFGFKVIKLPADDSIHDGTETLLVKKTRTDFAAIKQTLASIVNFLLPH